MKKMLIASVIFFTLFYFLLNFTLSHFFQDMQISKYSDLQEVKTDTAIQRGFIPANLPASASKIVESHDLDTNTIFGSFNYEEKDEKTFMQNLTDADNADDMLEWGNFLFKVDKNLNKVNFRNKPGSNSINKRTP